MSKKKGKSDEQAKNGSAVVEEAKPAEVSGGEEGGKPGEDGTNAAAEAAGGGGTVAAEEAGGGAQAELVEVRREATGVEEGGKLGESLEGSEASGAWAPGGSPEAVRLSKAVPIHFDDAVPGGDIVGHLVGGFDSLPNKLPNKLVGFDAMTIPSTFTPVGGVDRTDGLSLIAAAVDETLGRTVRTLDADADPVHDGLDAIAALAQELLWIGKALGSTAEIAAVAPANGLGAEELREHLGTHIERGERLAAMPAAFFLGLDNIRARIARIVAAIRSAVPGPVIPAHPERRREEAIPPASGGGWRDALIPKAKETSGISGLEELG